MEVLELFFQPYLHFLLGAAYNIQQTLEGLGLRTSWFLARDDSGRVVGSYLSAYEAVTIPFAGLFAYSVLLAAAMLLAIRSFAGWSGLKLGVAVICFPGILSVVGFWPNLQWNPDRYLAGSGDLGSPWGMFAVLVLGLLTGWSAVALLTATFRFGDKFRHGYDHVWYSMAVVTGLLFVADLGTSKATQELQQANKLSTGASAYLLQQVRQLSLRCQGGAVSAPAACSWASQVQGLLERYGQQSEALYSKLGPTKSMEIYLPRARVGEEAAVRAIRVELAEYNQIVCPVRDLGDGVRMSSPVSTRCHTPPPDYCTVAAESLAGRRMEAMMITPVAIASECVVPTLIAQKARQKHLAREVQVAEVARHWRWLFFVLAAVLAGGKVANASARLVDLGRKAATPPQLLATKVDGRAYRRCRWRRTASEMSGRLKMRQRQLHAGR